MGDGEEKTYSLAEVAEHNSNQSLWVVIDDKVYDITKFMDEVP
jgi:cytochrome b involved in lipid metabolism